MPPDSSRSLSALMAPLMLLVFLLTEAASEIFNQTVDPGDDVTLPCQADDSSILAVEWSRDDLKPPEYVLYYTDGNLDTTHQHPSFKDRVELVDRDLKDRDVSLTLKNVSSIDAGTYECRFASGGSRRRKRGISDLESIGFIRLQVTEPGSKSGHSEDENSMIDVPEVGNSSPGGRYHGLAAGVLVLVAAALVGVLMYKRHKDERSGQPAADDDDEASGDKLV